MEIQASRLRARVGADGEPVLLLDQDRARWDQLLIRRGLAALERAERARRRARARTRCRRRSPPATRARATAEDTDWARIAALYDALAAAHAVAGGRAQPRGGAGDGVGPAAGLELVDALRRRAGARATTTCCRACAATCWRSSAASTRRARVRARGAR